MYRFIKILFELFCESDFFQIKIEMCRGFLITENKQKQNHIDQLKSIFNNEDFRQFYRKNMMSSNNRSKTRKFQELFTLF